MLTHAQVPSDPLQQFQKHYHKNLVLYLAVFKTLSLFSLFLGGNKRPKNQITFL